MAGTGTDTGIEPLVEQAHRLAGHMSDSQKAAEGLSASFKSALLAIGGYEALNRMVSHMADRSQFIRAVNRAVSAEQLNQYSLMMRTREVRSEAAAMTALLHKEKRGITKQEEAQRDVMRQQLRELRAQSVFANELTRLGNVRLAAYGATAVIATDLFFKQRQLNQNLIEANSAWQKRSELLLETLHTQMRLGVSFDKATESIRALVHYGMDMESNFSTNVRLVAQMEQGLGISTQHSAQLASVVERQLRGSFERVADVVAQIVDDTSLAGDEAVRLAQNISMALGRLRPGLGAAGLPEVLRLVGRYEAALKEVGGQSGAFQHLLTQMTTPEGITGAGALGVNPEFLATSQGAQNVMDRFAQYGQMLVGQSQGWERQMRLQALAQMFGTSAEQANQMLLAIKRANEQQSGQITLQERWRNQLHATDQGIHRMANSLTGLMQYALYPVIFVIGAVINKTADFVESLFQHKAALTVVATAVLSYTLYLSIRMVNLARHLWAVVLSTNAVTAAMTRLQAAQAGVSLSSTIGRAGFVPMSATQAFLQNLFTFRKAGAATVGGMAAWFPTVTSGFSMLGTWLSRIFMGVRVLFGPLGLLLAVAGGVGYYVNKIWQEAKSANEAAKRQEPIILSAVDRLNAQRRQQFYANARYGQYDIAEQVYAAMTRDAAMKFTTGAERIEDPAQRLVAQRQWLEDQLQAAREDLRMAQMTREMYTPASERTPLELAQAAESLKLNNKLVALNEKQEKTLHQINQREVESQQEESVERTKALLRSYENYRIRHQGR